MIGPSPTGLDKTMRNNYQLKRTEAYRQHIESTPQEARDLAGWDFKQEEIIGLFFTHYYLYTRRIPSYWKSYSYTKNTHVERSIRRTPQGRYSVDVRWSVPDSQSRSKTFDTLQEARWWRDLKVYPEQFWLGREYIKELYAMQQDSLATNTPLPSVTKRSYMVLSKEYSPSSPDLLQ